MAVEIGDLSLTLLTQVSVRERSRLARHAVPGASGDLIQVTGRPSIEVELHGLCFGPTAADDLDKLRKLHANAEPVDFFADASGEGYFTQVLVQELDVSQHAGSLDQFEFRCQVVEYVEPPEPAVSDPFGAIDTGLLDEAAGFMDDVQNALEQVSDLVDLVANAPSFGDPTTRLQEMPREYEGLVSGDGITTLQRLRDLF